MWFPTVCILKFDSNTDETNDETSSNKKSDCFLSRKNQIKQNLRFLSFRTWFCLENWIIKKINRESIIYDRNGRGCQNVGSTIYLIFDYPVEWCEERRKEYEDQAKKKITLFDTSFRSFLYFSLSNFQSRKITLLFIIWDSDSMMRVYMSCYSSCYVTFYYALRTVLYLNRIIY